LERSGPDLLRRSNPGTVHMDLAQVVAPNLQCCIAANALVPIEERR
jgi:hypothetical protein